MILFELTLESIKNLMRHPLRSLLTALGIIFGIASVMAMVAIGEGGKREIMSQIGELGVTNIIINAKKPPADENLSGEGDSATLHYGLTFRDADQIRATLPFISSVLPVHDVEEWIWFRSRRLEAQVRGVTTDYFETMNLKPFMGRTLTEMDDIRERRVCIVRRKLIVESGYVGDPLKLDLKIGSDFYRVVGVLPDASYHSPNMAVLGIDGRTNEVYVPFRTVINRFGLENIKQRSGSSEKSRVELHQIVCKIDEERNVMRAAQCLSTLFGTLHKEQKDYEVTVPLELLESSRKTQQVFNIVLPIVAGISLLVGGIGVLNIMLASITERTREIGVRRAIGATRTDITFQFLVETVTLAIIGGIVGIIVGVGLTAILEEATGWTGVITGWALGLSLTISCLTGIIFGLYPARRAAKMDPIEALRRE